MKRIFLVFSFFIIPIFCGFSEVAPKSTEGSIDRSHFLPQIQKLKIGDDVDSLVKIFGTPFAKDSENEFTVIRYLYWPIPQKPVAEGQYPKGLIIFFRNNRLQKWEEWFGDSPR